MKHLDRLRFLANFACQSVCCGPRDGMLTAAPAALVIVVDSYDMPT
jgi:hypothetical protein